MRELSLRVEDPRIKINGQVFSLRLSDLALYTRAQALLERCARLADTPVTPDTALAAASEAGALLDEALGEGATYAISGGRPVSLPLALEWLGVLACEAANHYTAEALREEDTPDAEGGQVHAE